MVNKKKNLLKELLKDLPYSFGAASLAVILGIGQGVITVAGGIPMNKKIGKKMGIAGSTDWALRNSRDFISDYIDIKEILKNLTKNNSFVILNRLQNKGLVEKKDDKYILTFLGLKYFKRIKQKNSDREIKKWDGRWRVVMFDIPEKLRKERNWLRHQLYGLEYQLIQKSVFLGKWPLTEDFFNEITERRLNNFIRLITVGEIDDEEILKSFN